MKLLCSSWGLRVVLWDHCPTIKLHRIASRCLCFSVGCPLLKKTSTWCHIHVDWAQIIAVFVVPKTKNKIEKKKKFNFHP